MSQQASGGGPGLSQGQVKSSISQTKEAQLKSYSKRLKDDVRAILDNFSEIIKIGKTSDDTQVTRVSQCEQDNYEVHVRAANIVRAGESLMSLVSELKQFLILNDFPSVNEALVHRTQMLRTMQSDFDSKLLQMRDDLAEDLYEIEEEYYSSRYKKIQTVNQPTDTSNIVGDKS